MEKEIMESIKEWGEEKICMYFDRNEHHLKKFTEYVNTGKQMDRKRMLKRLSELYLSDLQCVGIDAITDYYCPDKSTGVAIRAYEGIFFEVSIDLTNLGSSYYEMLKQLQEADSTVRDNQRYVNREFLTLVNSRDIMQDVNPMCPPFVLTERSFSDFEFGYISGEQELNYLFNELLPRYENDMEMCAAICFGIWRLLYFNSLKIYY
jgi:hypothetical protein